MRNGAGEDGDADLLFRPERPGPWTRRYIVAVVVVVVGVLVGPVITIGYAVRLFGTVPGATSVRTPGSATITVERPGTYVAWIERSGFSTGGHREWAHVKASDVRVTLEGSGAKEVAQGTTERPSIGLIWIERTEVARFELEKGTYVVRAQSPVESLVLVAPSQDDAILKVVAIQIISILGVLAGVCGLVALPVIGVRHWRAVRRAQRPVSLKT